jgi:hypothetical protein
VDNATKSFNEFFEMNMNVTYNNNFWNLSDYLTPSDSCFLGQSWHTYYDTLKLYDHVKRNKTSSSGLHTLVHYNPSHITIGSDKGCLNLGANSVFDPYITLVCNGFDPYNYKGKNNIWNKWSSTRVMQHEWSHCFGTEDAYDEFTGNCSDDDCIMKKDYYDSETQKNIWCSNCRETIWRHRNEYISK